MRGNYLILTKEELNEFDKIYNFEIFNNLVIVGTNNCKKKTVHYADEGFSIFCKTLKKTLKITPYAIKVWNQHFKDKYHLPDIQNAINSLIILCQTPNLEDIKTQLNNQI